jgi:hypothetical protein
VKSEGKSATAAFTVRTLQGAKPATQPIEAVLGYTDDSGNRRGVKGTISVQQPASIGIN